MPTRSAGLLLFRRAAGQALEVLLAHPGGPFWTHRDVGAWTLPKGEYAEGETALDAAQREFLEETGIAVQGPFLPIGEVRQKSGKQVSAWAVEGNCDPALHQCNEFEMEWPPKSGRMRNFPEIDRVAWFTLEAAGHKIIPAQAPFLERLRDIF